MSMGLSQLDASIRGLAFAMAQAGRVDGDQVLGAAGANQTPAWALKPVAATTPGPQLRDRVLAERGLDQVALMQMTPQARYRAEVSVGAETAVRARQAPVTPAGAFVDIRV